MSCENRQTGMAKIVKNNKQYAPVNSGETQNIECQKGPFASSIATASVMGEAVSFTKPSIINSHLVMSRIVLLVFSVGRGKTNIPIRLSSGCYHSMAIVRVPGGISYSSSLPFSFICRLLGVLSLSLI